MPLTWPRPKTTRVANTQNHLHELQSQADGKALETFATDAKKLGAPAFLEKQRRDVIQEWSEAAYLNSDEVMERLDNRLRYVQMG